MNANARFHDAQADGRIVANLHEHESTKSSEFSEVIIETIIFYHFVVVSWTKNSAAIEVEGDCEVSLRSSSQQPPDINVKCDRLQP